MPPEAVRRHGEETVRGWVRGMLAVVFGFGTRFQEIEVKKDTLKVESRKKATVQARILAVNLQKRERKESKNVVEWTWMEDDWYLGEKSIREEK